ncbi:MAG TPA: competence/damage-inducible protein A [Candidatus Merdenecus merdavium]|nr:competence/damage-inducible protein A [Candidatus Merdenecus merdavium]
MVVELISVGTEILLGNIVNTNAAYLSRECALLGLSLYHQSSIGDNEERLYEAIERALKRSDIVILSGGLGPTKDDLTKETAAKVMGLSLVEDPHSKEQIAEYFKQIHAKVVTENNWKQSMIPEGAIVIDNDNGTAPGLILEKDGKSLILLPGPPRELIPMFQKDIAPYLSQLEPDMIVSETVKVCGIGESQAETMISDLIDEQSNPTIAPYAKLGEVHFRITAKAKDEVIARKLILPMVEELKNRFKEKVYTTLEEETLEESIYHLLKDKGLKLTTAESCSGGLLAGRIVNVPGVSEVFQQGFITYSNAAKRNLIGVKKSTLEEFGAVSPQTAKEMAKGCALTMGSEVGLSTTGIAGPGGGTDEKPVGLVYIGCYYKGKTIAKEFHFQGNRSKVRDSAVVQALILLRECILEDAK